VVSRFRSPVIGKQIWNALSLLFCSPRKLDFLLRLRKTVIVKCSIAFWRGRERVLALFPLPSGSDLPPKRLSVEMLEPWTSCNSATNARIHSGAVSETASVEQTLDLGNAFVAEVLAHRSLTVSSDSPYLLTI